MYEDEDNDGKFPDESPVEVRYPRSRQEEQGDRERWPWLPGTIVEQCGPDEWYVCIEVRELAVLRDGRRAQRGTASRNLYYPCCFRDGSEIRPRTASSRAAPATPGRTDHQSRVRLSHARGRGDGDECDEPTPGAERPVVVDRDHPLWRRHMPSSTNASTVPCPARSRLGEGADAPPTVIGRRGVGIGYFGGE